MQHEFRHALSAAKFFRSIGLVPLPSRMDRKSPTLASYREYQSDEVPDCIYSQDQWRTTNIQLMTGALTSGATKIIVIDLDGQESVDAWKRMCSTKEYKPDGLWIARTGSGGMHLYYRLQIELGSCDSRLLWGLYDPHGGQAGTGGWAKHKEVRLLGDGSLVVAPPSRHVRTGNEYRWVGKWSPAVYALPAYAPQWLLDMPGLELPIQPEPSRPKVYARDAPRRGESRRDAVLQSLSAEDKLRLAVSWGLRVGRGCSSRNTWVSCQAIDREDATPSAGFCPATGVYHDFGGSRLKLSLFDLAVSLGAHRDWMDAMSEAELRSACMASVAS